MTDIPSRHASWELDAACRNDPTALFFPTDGPDGWAADIIARTRCATCPVSTYCQREHADAVDGIFAGQRMDQRPPTGANTGRLPFDPLYRWLLARSGLPAHIDKGCGCQGSGNRRHACYSGKRLCTELAAEEHQVRSWRSIGILLDQADRVCDMYRIHPTEIWGTAYYDLGLIVCVCGTRFAPSAPLVRYCGPECRANARAASRRETRRDSNASRTARRAASRTAA